LASFIDQTFGRIFETCPLLSQRAEIRNSVSLTNLLHLKREKIQTLFQTYKSDGGLTLDALQNMFKDIGSRSPVFARLRNQSLLEHFAYSQMANPTDNSA